MELAHTSHTDQTQAVQDSILAAFLEPGALPDIAKRVNMSLASLATWASKHAELLDNVHKLLVTRCKLIAAHLELAALSALAAVSGASTPTDDAKLRERALERQRKAASAILRHKNKIERTPRANGGSHAPPNAVTHQSGVTPSSTNAQRPMSNAASPPHAASLPRSSLEQRLAARRLAELRLAELRAS